MSVEAEGRRRGPRGEASFFVENSLAKRKKLADVIEGGRAGRVFLSAVTAE